MPRRELINCREKMMRGKPRPTLPSELSSKCSLCAFHSLPVFYRLYTTFSVSHTSSMQVQSNPDTRLIITSLLRTVLALWPWGKKPLIFSLNLTKFYKNVYICVPLSIFVETKCTKMKKMVNLCLRQAANKRRLWKVRTLECELWCGYSKGTFQYIISCFGRSLWDKKGKKSEIEIFFTARNDIPLHKI